MILASPVSHPWREAHSFFSIGPAARWIAPSTGEETTGDSESWPTYENPLQSDYLQGVKMFFEVQQTHLQVCQSLVLKGPDNVGISAKQLNFLPSAGC